MSNEQKMKLCLLLNGCLCAVYLLLALLHILIDLKFNYGFMLIPLTQLFVCLPLQAYYERKARTEW